MSELLWTCGNGSEFTAIKAAYRLSVRRAEQSGYEFQIAPTRADGQTVLASGHHEDLREAVAIAEQTLTSLLGDRDGPQKPLP